MRKYLFPTAWILKAIGRRHVQCYDFSDAGAVETVCSSAYINQLLQGNGKKT